MSRISRMNIVWGRVCFANPDNSPRRLFAHPQSRRCICGTIRETEILDEIIKSRRKLQQMMPMETHRIAGVTFEDRQILLSRLVPGVSLIMEREPYNTHDPNAVAVRSLDGKKLGYIPKQETTPFIHSACFGKVRSVGPNQANGQLGCLIETQPKLPPVMNLSIPSDLILKCSKLVSCLEGSMWDAYKGEMLDRMDHRCTITGITTNHVEARWILEEPKKMVKLAGFAVQHEFLTEIQYINPSKTYNDRHSVVFAMARLNGIKEEEAEVLFSRQTDLSQARGDGSWCIDVAYLDDIGMSVSYL